MKILFFLAVWRRPEITEICFMGLNRLKRAGLFPCEFLAVISEESMKPLCKKYGIDYVMHENFPLGRKKNFGLNEAFKRSWDYIIELGSDDLIKTELFDFYKFDRPMLTTNRICFINSEDGECREFVCSTSYGLGRALERSALERVAKGVDVEALETLISPGRTTEKGSIGFFPKKDAEQMQSRGLCKIVGPERMRLWNDDINRRLDNNSRYFMAVNGMFDKRVDTDRPLCIDIKSSENIWAYDSSIGNPYDLSKALEGLSSEEKTAIKSLCENKVLESY